MKLIERLTAQLRANLYFMAQRPESKEKYEKENEQLQKQIDQIKNPKVHGDGTVVNNGDNCLAVQKNGKQCSCKRAHGNYCRRHVIHYVNEMEKNNECN